MEISLVIMLKKQVDCRVDFFLLLISVFVVR